MKRTYAAPLSIAALSLALLLPAYAQNGNQAGDQNGTMQNSGNMQGSQDSNNMNRPRGHHEAMRMVPARAELEHSLDADKTKPGFQFRAKLVDKVQLQNGPELPSGTLLLGKVVTDDMNESGTSKLALRFTQADLRDGQVVPIKATIVGVYQGEDRNSNDFPIAPGDQMPNSWNDGTLQVDQIGVISGVDLHSRISSHNSGVLVSTKKDNVKLDEGDELALAIAQRQQMHGMHGNMSGNMNGNMNGKNCNQ